MSPATKPGLLVGAALAGALALGGCAKEDLPDQATKIGGLVDSTEKKVSEIVAPKTASAEARVAQAAKKFTDGTIAALDAAERRLDAAKQEKTCANLDAAERAQLAKIAHETIGELISACGPELFRHNADVKIQKLDEMSLADLRAQAVSSNVDNTNNMPAYVASVSAALLAAMFVVGLIKKK